MHNFCSFVSSLHLLSPKTLAKDPLDSDQHEEMHSASETESEGGSDSEAVVNDAPSTNEGTVVSTHTDIAPAQIIQENSQLKGDTNLAPTSVECIEKDMDPIEREVLVHSPSTLQQQTQVTSFFLI